MATSDKKKGAESVKPAGKTGAKDVRAHDAKKGKPSSAPPPPPAGAAPPKRKLGIKGAAPWAARHAAKHAAEARARAAEPAPPGSARATIRTPNGADEIKEKLNELLKCTNQIKALKKNLGKNFFEIGQILRDVHARRLYEPRGYTTFEAFVDRETELGKEIGVKLARIAALFTKEAAMEMGLEKLMQGLAAIEQPKDFQSESKIAVAPKPPGTGVHRPVEPSGRAF